MNQSENLSLGLPRRGWKRLWSVIRQYELLNLTFILGLTVTALPKADLPGGVIAVCIGIGIVGGMIPRNRTMPFGAMIVVGLVLIAIIKSVARMQSGPWPWTALAIVGTLGSARILTSLIAAIASRTSSAQ